MTTPFTTADYARLPEGFPAQLIQGQLVKEPAPTYGHQQIVSRIHAQLLGLVGPDLALTSPVDVTIDEQNVFQPDLVVLRAVPPLASRDVGIPRLAFEVLSPSSAARDRREKKDRMLGAGTEEVWIVDPARGTIEVHDRRGVRVASGEQALASHALDGLVLTPSTLYAPRRRR